VLLKSFCGCFYRIVGMRFVACRYYTKTMQKFQLFLFIRAGMMAVSNASKNLQSVRLIAGTSDLGISLVVGGAFVCAP